MRTVRVSDTLWERMREIARAKDVTVSEVVTDALRRYERRRR